MAYLGNDCGLDSINNSCLEECETIMKLQYKYIAYSDHLHKEAYRFETLEEVAIFLFKHPYDGYLVYEIAKRILVNPKIAFDVEEA